VSSKHTCYKKNYIDSIFQNIIDNKPNKIDVVAGTVYWWCGVNTMRGYNLIKFALLFLEIITIL